MSKVLEQIEIASGYYSPGIYSNLLTFFGNLGTCSDPASVSFIPLAPRPPGGLLFAVGILPPAVNVTGRLLDRTTSIPITGVPLSPAAPKEGETAAKDSSTSDGGKQAAIHRAARAALLIAFRRVMGRDPTLDELLYAHAIGYLETRYGMGWHGPMQGSNNWGAVHCPAHAQNGPNCISYQDSDSAGKPFKVSFKKYATAEDGAADLIHNIFVQRETAKGLAEGGSIMKASYIMRRQKYYGGYCPKAVAKYGAAAGGVRSFQHPDKDDGAKACAEEAISAHANLVHSLENDVAGANGDSYITGLGTYEDAANFYASTFGTEGAIGGAVGADSVSSGDWNDLGSKNADKALTEQGKLQESPLLSSKLGKALLAAQLDQVKRTKDAIDKMRRCPPLAMRINPASFSVKGEKIVNDGNWGRNGPIIEYWGDNQDKISGSGKIGGFYAIDTANANGPGITRWARNFSASWQNFQALYLLYRSNGALFLKDDFSLVGSVYIYYDSAIYIGSFDSFNMTEDANTPFTVEYSFEFTVRAAFLLDQNFSYA